MQLLWVAVCWPTKIASLYRDRTASRLLPLRFPDALLVCANAPALPFLSCDLGAEQPPLYADVIGVGSSRDPAAPFLDTVTVQG